MNSLGKLDLNNYRNEDVLFLAKDLLGKMRSIRIDGLQTKVIITETEAYNGIGDLMRLVDEKLKSAWS